MTPVSGFHGSRSAESGFVLVGVVVFILALTILGLSLFSLSSFEAQFLSRSSRSTQALYDAMGGVEWAKMVLTKEKKLEAVADGSAASLATRPARVTWVEAWQNGNTTGGLAYGESNPVRIRALADDGRGEKRMVEVQFVPNSPDSLYGALVDSYADFALGQIPNLRLFGPVRIRDSNSLDWLSVAQPPSDLVDWGHNTPQPSLTAFWSQHWGGAAPAVRNGPGSWTLAGSPTGVNYFKTSNPDVSVLESVPTQIQVTGTCVWMLDHGIRVDGLTQVTSTGPGNARLVIVSKRIEALNPFSTYGYAPPPYIGIWFYTALQSSNVPVVLVSDSRVVIETSGTTTISTAVEDIAIFADGVRLLAPELAGRTMRLVHDSNTDSILQELAGEGALPGSSGSSAAFDPIRGTWRELDPDNPS